MAAEMASGLLGQMIDLIRDRILAEDADAGRSGFSNLAKRVTLSKDAKITAEAMVEHIKKCNFESVSRLPPIPATSPVPFGKLIYEFNSRKRFEEVIMKSLNKDKNVDKIGVWGIGGVGKTIMAQKILNRALKEGLFHEAVMVTVSHLVDKLVIQKKIAGMLGLTIEDHETLACRADRLRRRLRQEKRSLILLDDVWKVLNLEELGIPCDGVWCTIILTSRNKDVLKGMMEAENICELGVLDEDEAWDFFKKMAGTCVDDPILKPVAYEVMKECKGLLVALETVGKAHIDEERQVVWRDSLEQLRKHNPVDIPYVIKEVYKLLKLSYDRLESRNAKSTMLLCCLFAEGADIPLEHLTYFAMGLRLFDDTWELEGVRGRIRRSIETLRSRCLLLDGRDEDCVRMHDVVRDVSIFIASEERRVKCDDCTWISSHVDGGARPSQSCFPKLKLLLMNNKVEEKMETNIGNLIGGSTDFNVLFIEKHSLMRSLPIHTPQSLKNNLTTLVLHQCEALESIAVVGELESLEILICHDCRSIKELPEQLRGSLKCLKLLEISNCRNLKRVAAGVISSLVRLEELKIVRSFNNWKGGKIHEEGKEATTDAVLREIESLEKLRCLVIRVSDLALAAQPLRLSFDKLVQFQVHFGKDFGGFGFDVPKGRYQRIMSLYVDSDIDIDLSKNIFMTHTECLHALGYNQDFKLNLATAGSLKWLGLDNFTNEKNITSAASAFPLLEVLSLAHMNNLEEIWDNGAPVPSNSFNNLKHLSLVEMPALKRMGKSVLSTANDFFLQLETIHIRDCSGMEHLLLLTPNEEEEKDKGNHISRVLIFPKLKTLILSGLPKLKSMICNSSSRGIESIQFPLLAQMVIGGCKDLKWLVSRDDDDDHYKDDDNDSLHLFCHPKVSFPKLERLNLVDERHIKNVWCDKVPMDFFKGLVELNIYFCYKIKRLFSSSSKIPQNLVSLQKLEIFNCQEMVKVIEDDEEVSSSSSCDDHPTIHTPLLFPSLQHITLSHLPKLESFCEWRCALKLPSLKILDIYKCDEMKSFNAGAGSLIITPALQTVTINRQDLECVDDLNDALHQQFQKAKRDIFHEGEELTSPVEKKPKISMEDEDSEFDLDNRDYPSIGVPRAVPERCIKHGKLFLPDREFDREKLVRMWIAEGCIEVGVANRMEDAGNLYFDALVHDGVILPSKFDGILRQMMYKFNTSKGSDVQDTYMRINARNTNENYSEALHLTWLCKRFDRTFSDALKNFKHLHTLVVHGDQCAVEGQLPSDMFLGLRLLRTLDLSCTRVAEVPYSIGKAESLRYLDLCGTPIKELPNSVDRLTFLQTLNLKGCKSLSALPRGFGKLTDLRHLDLDIVNQLRSMPKEMGNLVKLQTLQGFIVGGKNDGCGIGELKSMNDITGSFYISRLENVSNAEEAKEAALSDKKYIDKLVLRWNNCDDDDDDDDNLEDTSEILESLQPHFNLEELQLAFYSGSKLPRWISNPAYADLTSITLHKCINCDILPSIGELPSLKALNIFNMVSVRNINTLLCRKSESEALNAFPCLEELVLDCMPSLEEWSGVEDGDFPCLRRVSILYCPKLRLIPSLSHFCSLEKLEISHCMELISLSEGLLPGSLESLFVRCCPGINETYLKDGKAAGSKIASVRNIWIDLERISLD